MITMKKITHKTILITGGASGIGKSMANIFAQMDNTVIVWDIHTKNIKILETEAAENKLRIYGMICDITDRETVYAKAVEVIETFGTPDIVINSAGIVSGKSLLDAEDRDILLTMNVNTLSLFWITKAFLPAMIEKGTGHIVTIASAAGLIGVKKLVDYSASKFAAVGFMESLRMELSSTYTGIKTTVVCPFFIDTGMFSGVQTRFPLLLPILKQDYTAKKIVQAIIKKKPVLIMPRFVHSIYGLRLLPVKFFDSVTNFFGVNQSMEHFIGRK
ncbi:MAG: SDR family oxidoreductase [Treponema sp.]